MELNSVKWLKQKVGTCNWQLDNSQAETKNTEQRIKRATKKKKERKTTKKGNKKNCMRAEMQRETQQNVAHKAKTEKNHRNETP